MRVALAILFLAVAANAFDFMAYHQGFINQFNFTQTESQDGLTCFAGIAQTIQTAKTAVQNKDLATILELAQSFKADLAQYCGAYAADFQAYAQAHATMQPKQAFQTYAPQIIQDFTQWVNLLIAGQDEQAGQQEAYILQVLIGAQTPVAIQYPTFNFTEYVPMNTTEFLPEYYASFFSALGFGTTEDNTEAIQGCMFAFVAQTPNVQEATANWNTADFDGKIDAIQGVVEAIFTATKSCQAAIDLNLSFMELVFEAFKADPVHYILTSFNNAGLNFVELVQTNMQVAQEEFTGNYAEAGVLTANIEKVVLNGLVEFNN